MSERKFKLNESTLDGILQYLGTRPFTEVSSIIEATRTEILPETKKGVSEILDDMFIEAGFSSEKEYMNGRFPEGSLLCDESFQEVPEGEDAFNLRPAISGKRTELIEHETGYNKDLILRHFIGVANAIRMTKSFPEFCKYMYKLEEEILRSVFNKYGSLCRVKIKYERPGEKKGVYFKHVENSGAIEFRVYIEYKGA